ncbi:MAG: hypothetical protein V4813_17210 [Gemmatimonadota bacterium]
MTDLPDLETGLPATPLTPLVEAPAAPPPPPPKPVLPDMPDSPVRVPVRWLMREATGAVQYRAIVELAKLKPAVEAQPITLLQASALKCAVTMHLDGTWGGRLFPKAGEAPHTATFSAFRHLLECGWDRDSPPLAVSRRFLFRLLAMDEEPGMLYELGEAAGNSKEHAKRLRANVRVEAAALLAQAGYERDPRVRGAAIRATQRVMDYLRSPLAQKPWIRVGNKQVLDPAAAPPTMSFLRMAAFMPELRTEYHMGMELLGKHLMQPEPRQEPVQQIDGMLVPVPNAVLGDRLPHRNALEADVPAALHWLEIMVRLGVFRRHEPWIKMFERFVESADRYGVWHPMKGDAMPATTAAELIGWFPLEDQSTEGERRWSDVTLRVSLIAKLIGRDLNLV